MYYFNLHSFLLPNISYNPYMELRTFLNQTQLSF